MTHLRFFCLLLFTAYAAGGAELRLLSAGEKQLFVEWNLDSLSRREVLGKEEIFTVLSFNGADWYGELGGPRLPIKNALVGLPIEGEAQIQVIEDETETLTNLLLAPTPRLERTEIGFREIYEMNPQHYQASAPTFSEPIRLDEPYWFRDQRVAALRIFPVSYVPSRREAVVHKRMVIRIDFPATNDLPVALTSDDESLYRSLLLNYEQARPWRRQTSPTLRRPAMNQFAGDNWFKIVISAKNTPNREGIYKLTGAALKQVVGSATLASIDPATIQLFNNGGKPISTQVVLAKNDTLIETPIAVVGGEDGRFDESDYILFYGRSVEGIEHQPSKSRLAHYINPFTYDNCYWLTFNKRPGKRIKTIASQEVNDLSPQPSFRDLMWV
ncbi:MAG: hypothetical protein ONB12_13535, partial [candidate division KSB1 bacterium]|nr:hypothetical protein [candidate division KSB1 bacterium]